MQSASQARTQNLANLIGETALGKPPGYLPSMEEFSSWIQQLLLRFHCDQPIVIPASGRQGLLGSSPKDAESDPHVMPSFFLRLGLKMAEATYRQAIQPRPEPDPALLKRYEQLLADRPKALSKFSQGLIDSISSLRRALEIKNRLGEGLYSLLLVGDDDATSIALALVAPAYRLKVIDIDERVLEILRKASDQLGADIETEIVDLRAGVPYHFARRFEGVITDPPRNYRGCLDFLRFSVGCLADSPASRIFWSDHPDWTLNHAEVVRQLPRLGLRVEDIVPELHRYPDPPVPDAETEDQRLVTDRVQVNQQFSQVLVSVIHTFGLDPRWVQDLALCTDPWSHLHILARANPG